MRVKLIILILKILKHFNDVLRNIDVDIDEMGRLDKKSHKIHKDILKEIKYQEKKLVK